MIIAGRYELGEPLGAGGEARVFRARDRTTGKEAAVRVGPRQAPSWQPIAPAHNPGWVQQLDRGFDEQIGTFSVYELLQGDTLAALVPRTPLDVSAWTAFVHESLASVSALHDAGWVHGDLNAGNFLLEGGKTWKLLELPFHQAAPLESRSPLFGSIYNLAPEQIEGRHPDTRSDVYSLACLYYYAASGKYPHDGGSEAEIAVGRLRFAPHTLAELAPALPSHLADWTHCLLARDPAERPTNAGAALASLDR